MAAEKPAKGEPALIKEYFFNPPESTDGKWKCKLCEGALTWRGSLIFWLFCVRSAHDRLPQQHMEERLE
jgi:hypothetical protein